MNTETNTRGRRFCRIRLGGFIAGMAVYATTLPAHAISINSYTNLKSGATYTFDGDIATGTHQVGVSFGYGLGDGGLDGIGNLTITNVNQNSIYGIRGVSTNAWDGTLRVESDQSELGTSDHLYVVGFSSNVVGALDGDVVVIAKASSEVSDASASAYGIDGNISSNLNGRVTVTALGGEGILSGNAQAYGVDGSIGGDLLGDIIVSATAVQGSDRADARAYGVNGGINGDLSGIITATAKAGENSGYGFAAAYGVIGGDVTGDLSGTVKATATGGMNSGAANAVAAGIWGSIDGTVSGTIEATAIAGFEETAATASAYGVYLDNNSEGLTVDGGTIHATIGALDGLEPELGSVAYSIFVDEGDDPLTDQVVTLSNADLIGDIELADGANELIILGDTHMDGDIMATGGSLSFAVEQGILTFAQSTSVLNLDPGGLSVSENGGLGFELVANTPNTLSIDGDLNIEEGATLSIVAAPGQNGADLLDNDYVVIDATGSINGSFIDNQTLLLVFDINTNIANQVSVTPTGLHYQDSQVAANQSLAVAGAVNATMSHLSRQASQSRAAVRGLSNVQQVDIEQPEGPAGPDSEEKSEWTTFVHQVNDLGGIDSDSSVAGNDWSSHGFLFGADKVVGEQLIVGAAAGGTWTDLDGKDNSGGGNSEMANVAVYASHFSETYYVEGGLTYAYSWNDGSRIDTAGDTYQSENDSSMLGGWLEYGSVFPVSERVQLEPYGRLAYVHGEHDGFTETGSAGSPMTVKAHKTDNLISTIGVRGITSWTLQNESQIKLGLAAGWRREWMDDIISVNSSVIGINQQTRSSKADRDALALGLDAKWLLSDAWSFGLAYEPTISGNWFNHAINGTLKYRF